MTAYYVECGYQYRGPLEEPAKFVQYASTSAPNTHKNVDFD